MLFDGWENLARTALAALLAYAAIVLLLRVSGKRTLSKWNAFDLIVTVALGSSLATAILSRDVAVAQGVLAFALLIGFQFLVTWLSVRLRGVERAVKASPVLLVHRGRFLEEEMRRERVPEAEVRAALRGQGISSVEEVAAVVLETDGSFSVVRELGDGRATALSDVRGFEEREAGR